MAEKILQQNVAEAAEEYSCIFGANKNLYRTIPSLQDGLKPGKRRVFYSWWVDNGKPTNTKKETLSKLKFTKVNTVASKCMADYHPHADTSSADVITSEGQYWNNNVRTVVPQGNYGSIRGDAPAAGRYIECKISEYMIDCFFDDFDKYCVPMKETYDGRNMEPEYLPAKYPHALFNPQLSGIGYGLASNIVSFNVGEVLKATIKLIKDKNAKIMLIPDIPTGADIIDNGYFKEINKTGVGKVALRATAEIDHINNIIKFVSLPLQMTSMQVISKILDFKAKGEFQDIIDIADYTQEGRVDLRISLKNSANPDKVLKKLYKKGTGLKTTVPCCIKLIDDYSEHDYGVKSFLLAWIDYRQFVVRSMFTNYRTQAMEKQHMNDVLLLVFSADNAEQTLKICKTSGSRKETIEKLMKKYKITSLQAATIADMRLYNFNRDSYQKYKDTKVELENEIKRIDKILDDESEIDKFIIGQLEEGIKKYATPRKSKVVKDDQETEIELIPDTNHLIAISTTGFIKKIDDKFESIGPIGKGNDNYSAIRINNRDDIIIIDSSGVGSRIPVSTFPDMKYDESGVELSRFFQCDGKVVAIMKMPDKAVLKDKNNSVCIILVTQFGFVKRIKLSDFKGISSPRSSIILNENDKVVSATFCLQDSTNDIIIYTEKGYGIRIPISDIKISGRAAKGSSYLKLGENDKVTNADIIDPSKKTLFYITSSGNGKLTQERYFPQMKRNDEPLQLITLGATETLIHVASVNRKKDKVQVYFKQKEPEIIDLSKLEVSTRISKGQKLVKVPRGEAVLSVKIFK